MITILSSLIGVITGLMPALVKLMERKAQNAHELELLKLQLQAQTQGVEFQSMADEARSLHDHDKSISTGGFLDTLRASIRPVVTYFFFFMFCGVKIAAATFMFNSNYNALEILAGVWDIYTMALFGAVLGFWFGNRSIVRLNQNFSEQRSVYQLTAQRSKK